MQVIKEGHNYHLKHAQSNGYESIQFIEKIPYKLYKELYANAPIFNIGDEQLITLYDGTTSEEVLKILIDRMNYLQGKFPCRENAIALTHIETALLWLNERTNRRKQQNVEGKNINHK